MPRAGAQGESISALPKTFINPMSALAFKPQGTQIFACPVLSKSPIIACSLAVLEKQGSECRITGVELEPSIILI